jgi:hypothetical protein
MALAACGPPPGQPTLADQPVVTGPPAPEATPTPPATVTREATATPVAPDTPTTTPVAAGHILLVNNGDLWQMSANGADAVKLIDLDTIRRACRSPVSNRIAYGLEAYSTESVTAPDGTVQDVDLTRQQLLLADERGSDSFLVHDNVSRWGWIPATDLLWYETASLQQLFEWEYLGDGRVWIFDAATRTAEPFLHDDSQPWPLLRAEWSPDGNRLMYVSGNSLRVADRQTRAPRSLFRLPYVGGDRGGPQPIPFFAWAPDSSSIYAIFSPYVFPEDEPHPQVSLKSEHVFALRLPVDGGRAVQLMPEVPSVLLNEESYPRAHFSDDFSKAIYPRAAQSEADLVLAMYDFADRKEYVLLEDPGMPERELMPYGVPLAWVVGDSTYLLRGEGDSVSLLKVDYRTGSSETLAGRDGVSGRIGNVLFLPEAETLFFTSGGKLYSMNRDGVVPIADDLGDASQVEYHLE